MPIACERNRGDQGSGGGPPRGCAGPAPSAARVNGTGGERPKDTLMKRLFFAGSMLAIATLAGCFDDRDSPYLELRGGGFQFNYRIAEATGTLVVGSLRTLPASSVV